MYVITGGFGQIGLYLTRRLLARGKDVVLFDTRTGFADLELICGPQARDKISWIVGDLSCATEFVSVVADHRPDAIIHLASVLPPIAERNSHFTMSQNVGGMTNVLEAARIFKTRRVIFASASSVFGPPRRHGGPDAVVSDDAPHYPATLYGITKSTMERLATYYRAHHGVETIGFRICQGYGPGKRRGKAFGYEMFENALDGRPMAVPCGDDIVNWQYIEDIATIFERGIDAPHTGLDVYNTSGEIRTMAESMAVLEELAPGFKARLEPGTAGLVWRYDTARLRTDFGLPEPTPMKTGFEQSLAIMRRWRESGLAQAT